MGADLDEAGAVEDDDEVGHAHGAEAVRHQDRDAAIVAVAAGAGRVALEQRVLGLGVEGGGGLVEHQQQRLVAHEAAGERELLPLAKGDLDAAGPCGAELRLEARAQPIHDIVGTGAANGGDDGGLVVEPGHITDAHGVAGPELEAEEVLERPAMRARHASAGMRMSGWPST